PKALIDLDRDFGWVTPTPRNRHQGHFAIIELPKAIDVSSFGLDPGPTCFDTRPKFAVAHFAIYTSRNGDRWTLAVERRRPLPTGKTRTLEVTRGGNNVRFVRLVVFSARSRHAYDIEVAELTVRGTPA